MQSIKLLVHIGYGDQSCVHMYIPARTKVSAKRSLAGFENTCSAPFAHYQECSSNSMNDTSLVNLQRDLNFTVSCRLLLLIKGMLWKRNHFHQHQCHLYQCSLTSHSSSTIMSSLIPSISVEMILEEWTSLHHITNQLRSRLIPILFVWNVEDSFAEEKYRSSWNTMRGVMVDKMLTLSHTHVYKYTHTPVHITTGCACSYNFSTAVNTVDPLYTELKMTESTTAWEYEYVGHTLWQNWKLLVFFMWFSHSNWTV